MKNLIALLLVVLMIAACSPASTASKIAVENVWGRSSPKVAEAGAFYLSIKNTGAASDKLIGVKSSVCGTAELHETVAGSGGVMEMRPIAGQVIEIPANGTVDLKPGGMHVMCMMKKADFATGTKLPLTLVFEKSGEMNFDADIREQ